MARVLVTLLHVEEGNDGPSRGFFAGHLATADVPGQKASRGRLDPHGIEPQGALTGD